MRKDRDKHPVKTTGNLRLHALENTNLYTADKDKPGALLVHIQK